MGNVIVYYEETGEVRPPLAGEWFFGYEGMPTQARFDFTQQRFRIARQVVQRADALEGKTGAGDE